MNSPDRKNTLLRAVRHGYDVDVYGCAILARNYSKAKTSDTKNTLLRAWELGYDIDWWGYDLIGLTEATSRGDNGNTAIYKVLRKLVDLDLSKKSKGEIT